MHAYVFIESSFRFFITRVDIFLFESFMMRVIFTCNC